MSRSTVAQGAWKIDVARARTLACPIIILHSIKGVLSSRLFLDRISGDGGDGYDCLLARGERTSDASLPDIPYHWTAIAKAKSRVRYAPA